MHKNLLEVVTLLLVWYRALDEERQFYVSVKIDYMVKKARLEALQALLDEEIRLTLLKAFDGLSDD